jgi:FtsP/CotA-like multicopper oxidase with cupredoxin domain
MHSKQIRSKKLLTLLPIALLIVSIAATFHFYTAVAVKQPKPLPLFIDPKTIPKYANQLVIPPVYAPDDGTTANYTVTMVNTTQPILPQGFILPDGTAYTGTSVWGYQGNVTVKGSTLTQFKTAWNDGSPIQDFVWSPSATFEAVNDTAIKVIWVNNITAPQPFAVDPTLYWANPWKNYDITQAFPDGDTFSKQGNFLPFPPGYDGATYDPWLQKTLNAQSPVALVPHLHGAEVPSEYDGGPEAWWTSATTNLRGPHYNTVGGTAPNGTAVYEYPNTQPAGTLWYHDHALGITRLNVMSGLAGFYLLRDSPATYTLPLTADNFDEYLTATFQYGISEIPLAIQDRTFQANGEFWFPEVGLNINDHPYWQPEFFGDTIMVNGLVWPNLDVTPGWYRFRLLNGSNARFYTISLKLGKGGKLPFIMIGSDGSYLTAPVTLQTLTIAPGERADILVDFSAVPVNTKIIVENKAKTPFPNGAVPDPQTTGQIMQFTVKAPGTTLYGTEGVTTIQPLPAQLNPYLTAFPTLPTTTIKRFITLNEVMGLAGPLMALINGQHYWGIATENATQGSVEDWVIINLTGDTHPIHLHLVTFQLISRQPLQAAKYNTAWLLQQTDPLLGQLVPPFPPGYIPLPLDPTPYLQGKNATAPPQEMAWKDTIQMNPGEVTTIRVKIAPADGSATFPFDPTTGPGYVYHCHILDHEDNEMMRPFIIE